AAVLRVVDLVEDVLVWRRQVVKAQSPGDGGDGADHQQGMDVPALASAAALDPRLEPQREVVLLVFEGRAGRGRRGRRGGHVSGRIAGPDREEAGTVTHNRGDGRFSWHALPRGH